MGPSGRSGDDDTFGVQEPRSNRATRIAVSSVAAYSSGSRVTEVQIAGDRHLVGVEQDRLAGGQLVGRRHLDAEQSIDGIGGEVGLQEVATLTSPGLAQRDEVPRVDEPSVGVTSAACASWRSRPGSCPGCRRRARRSGLPA